jgi:hypothetical protein
MSKSHDQGYTSRNECITPAQALFVINFIGRIRGCESSEECESATMSEAATRQVHSGPRKKTKHVKFARVRNCEQFRVQITLTARAHDHRKRKSHCDGFVDSRAHFDRW